MRFSLIFFLLLYFCMFVSTYRYSQSMKISSGCIISNFILQRGTQKVSITCRILVGCFLLLILDRFYLAIFGTVSWLDWLYFLSMVKIGITLLKYIPQAHFNYQRQSTRGWTVGTVLLDLLGGTFSLAQMFINAWNHGMFL